MKMKPTHIALEKGCDARTPDNYRGEILIRESKNFWITSTGHKYRKPNGRGLGTWPMFELIPQSIKPLPAYTATLVKNDKVVSPNTNFKKQVSLWDEGDNYRTIYNTFYRKTDGYPTVPDRPVKLELSTVKQFVLPKGK
jgi:hypothetical protein